MEIPSSKHMLELTYRWPLEKAIGTSVEATAFAHKNGLEVVFFPIRATHGAAHPSRRVAFATLLRMRRRAVPGKSSLTASRC